LPHLHLRSGDAPLAAIEIDFAPLRVPQFTRPYEEERYEPQRRSGYGMTIVTFDRSQNGSDGGRLGDSGPMFHLGGCQGAAEIGRWITLGTTRRNRVPE